MSKMPVLLTLIATIVSGPPAAVAAQASAPKTPRPTGTAARAASAIDRKTNCTYQTNPTGDPPIFANTCPDTLAFTISWYGNAPPREVTYRFNGQGERKVIRQDIHGTVVREAPATEGGNPVELHPSVEPIGGGTQLYVVRNPSPHYVFVRFEFDVRNADGSLAYPVARSGHVIPPSPNGLWRIGAINEGQTIVIKYLKAYEDPD
jgi:hypothetical protein